MNFNEILFCPQWEVIDNVKVDQDSTNIMWDVLYPNEEIFNFTSFDIHSLLQTELS
jgi:hypothetical protein